MQNSRELRSVEQSNFVPPGFTRTFRVSPEKQRQHGIYYTPKSLSDILCDWAIRSPNDLVFEPSFGGCVFIESILETLHKRKSHNPEKNIFGCDTDPTAFRHLADTVTKRIQQKHFVRSDFLKVKPEAFGKRKFDVITGNPPYISLHNMRPKQLEAALAIQSSEGIILEKRASLWAYFVLHALEFLKVGGRMALVLPGSLIHAEYGKDLLHQLSEHFARLSVISLTERYFTASGADESTELLLCDSWKRGPSINGVEIGNARNTETCRNLILRWKKKAWTGPQLNGQAVPHLINAKGAELLQKWRNSGQAQPFGNFATVRIGVVTGANHFFVVNQATAKAAKIPKQALDFIVPKAKLCPGIFLRQWDANSAIKNESRCLIVQKSSAPKHERIKAYFRKFPRDEKIINRTFVKRKSWAEPDMGKIPDAFLSYMNHRSPRLILNNIRANSTNTVHRIYFDKSCSELTKLLVAISFHSTLTQLSAELEGRVYGSGVLKLEPNEAVKLLVVVPESVSLKKAKNMARKVDRVLRNGKVEEATLLADDFLTKYMPGLWAENKLEELQSALHAARARRYPTLRLKPVKQIG